MRKHTPTPASGAAEADTEEEAKRLDSEMPHRRDVQEVTESEGDTEEKERGRGGPEEGGHDRGEEGREMEDPALLAPDLLGGERADGRVSGGRGGGRSPKGDAREPLQ